MRPDRSLILDISIRPIFHVAMLFSIFLLFAGHNAPGGGFIGGLVGGAAVMLRYVEGGDAEVRRMIRPSPETVLGVGLTLAILTGVAPWMVGKDLFEAAKFSAEIPGLGLVKATSALPFDVGVYLVVIGLVLSVLRSLGGEE